ncbi:hypothetical protein J2X65_001312 [Ancylobacter sp. 3268]|uniref:hypothetical protein n=1 Tax=Ancylobacter sp. 3268 TaxID=2817752 RepID=UPI0028581796|nr:hypothetical protein [Ancylobacter sp. 3268]MDR6951961.1 hypothetical protein [Ancylobacter sp. 3268]
MRFIPLALALAVAGSAFAVLPAAAQDSTRLTIRKLPERSYLDPGPNVRPGTSRDLNYIGLNNFRFPSYGTDSTITGTRWPLPGPYELPR